MNSTGISFLQSVFKRAREISIGYWISAAMDKAHNFRGDAFSRKIEQSNL